MAIFHTEMAKKIPFYDIDMMNVVWHGNYIKYMEEARCDMFEKLKYSYLDMKDDGVAYPIAKMNTKFIRPAVFGQEIIIKTDLIEIAPAMNIKYKMFDKQTGEKLFEGETMQIAIDIHTKESRYEAPERLVKIIGEINEK